MTDEEELMTALYTEHYGVLLSFISRYVRDRHRAEDLVQETLLRAWKHIDQIDASEADQRRPQLVEGEATINSLPSADSVDAMIEGWLVGEALDRLSVDHRDVVRSLYYEGRTVADTAQRLSLPEGTVKSRAYYAVRALRVAFEEMGVLR